MGSWWITDGVLAAGGKKILGPFVSQGLAIQVRSMLEFRTSSPSYWIDEEEPRLPGRSTPSCYVDGQEIRDKDGHKWRYSEPQDVWHLVLGFETAGVPAGEPQLTSARSWDRLVHEFGTGF